MVNTSKPSLYYTFKTVSESSRTDTLWGGGKQYSLATRGVNNLRVSIEIPKTSNFIPGRYTLGLNAGLVMN